MEPLRASIYAAQRFREAIEPDREDYRMGQLICDILMNADIEFIKGNFDRWL